MGEDQSPLGGLQIGRILALGVLERFPCEAVSMATALDLENGTGDGITAIGDFETDGDIQSGRFST